MLVSVLWREENRSTRTKIPRTRDENQQQTQPTYDAETGNRTRATLVRGECSHHYTIPAPLTKAKCSRRQRSDVLIYGGQLNLPF